jgi:hypothetical protein
MYKQSRAIGILILGILLVGIVAFTATVIYNNAIPAVQAAPPVSEVSHDSNIPDDYNWRDNCVIAEMMIRDDSLSVKCTVPGPNVGLYWFAIHADAAHSLIANRFLVMLNTAYALNKPIYMLFDTDTSHNSPGCIPSDCRLIVWMGITP